MTRLRSFGAWAGRLRGRACGASARQARLRLLLLVAALGFAARPAAAQTEIVEYYGHDALGSIRIVFTASGVATARADYEPFGEAVTIAGMPAGPLPAQQFTGQERDALESQDYFGARYYRPRHGRFSQVDPVWGNLFDPQQLNRYAYVGNSPLRHVDPDGRMRLDADCQQLDLTFAKCAAYKAPDSFLAGVFGWQQFLRQGPTFSGGDPGGRRPKGPTEGGEAADGSDGDDGSGDGENEQVGQTLNPLTDVLGQAAPVSQALAAGAVAGLAGAANLPILTAIRLPFVAAGIRAVAYSNPNTLNHIFAPKHHLHLLGSRSAVLRQLSSEVARSFLGGQLGRGPFNEVYYMNGYVVRVTGAVVNGAPRISNAWVLRRMGT